MYIKGNSKIDYNFNGISMEDNFQEAEFYDKPCLIIISYFDSKLPIGSVSYILKHFKKPLQEQELNILIKKVFDFFDSNVGDKYPSFKPNYIGYYTEGDLSEIYQDIINGNEYKKTFKIFD